MTNQLNTSDLLHLAVPKGRTEDGVIALLSDAGIRLRSGPRGYRPVSSVPGLEEQGDHPVFGPSLGDGQVE
jgi:hypothetical protein